MKNTVFILGLIMLIYSCGKDIANAIATVPSNVTSAAWRQTRSKIAFTATDQEKDQRCEAEFGSDFVAGTVFELQGFMGWNYTPRMVTALFEPGMYGSMCDSNGVCTNHTPDPTSIFCIHK